MITKAKLLKRVRESIARWNPPSGDFEMKVIEDEVHKEGDFWLVPIYPTRTPQRNYIFIDSLAEVETELFLEQNLNVHVVPAEPVEGSN